MTQIIGIHIFGVLDLHQSTLPLQSHLQVLGKYFQSVDQLKISNHSTCLIKYVRGPIVGTSNSINNFDFCNRSIIIYLLQQPKMFHLVCDHKMCKLSFQVS